MKIKQIKESVTCLDYLGVRVVRKTANGWLARAPWREDKNPSLSVTANGRGWHDLATGEHGSVIDLVMRHHGVTMEGAYDILLRENPSFSFSQPMTSDGEKKKDGGFAAFQVVKLQSRGLFAYLYQRKVNLEIAKQFLKEAHYSFETRTDGRYLYSLAYQNDRGGYELRGAPYTGNPDGFKGGTSPKGITTHVYRENAPVVVFEGFFDMLSFATLCGGVKHNYVVLNSIVNKEAALDALKMSQNQVYLCLDNDKGGEDTTAWFLKQLPSAIDIRGRFAPAKDVSEYLMNIPKN